MNEQVPLVTVGFALAVNLKGAVLSTMLSGCECLILAVSLISSDIAEH